MIQRCYLEITNRCNLRCTFCPGCSRTPQKMDEETFERLTDRLVGQVRFLYFHLMGEPLLHPLLPQFICRAREKGFVPVVTTNGTLLDRRPDLVEAAPYKVQISLHALSGNEGMEMSRYIAGVAAYARKAAEKGTLVIVRLWNLSDDDASTSSMNALWLDELTCYLPRPWTERPDGWRLAHNIYVEYDHRFEWPDATLPELSRQHFCYALRNQVGVLVDGTVVPCCLDSEGQLALGNLCEQTLDAILQSDRAQALYDGFSRHEPSEELCRRCGYAAQTHLFRPKREGGE